MSADAELFNACRDGDLREVNRLLATGADVNARFLDTPLSIASMRAHLDVVRCLLDHGAVIDGTNQFGCVLFVCFKECFLLAELRDDKR